MLKRCLRFVIVGLLAFPGVVQAQFTGAIDSPQGKANGVINGYGWACLNGQPASPLFISFDNGSKTQIASQLFRPDTAPFCGGNPNTGFGFVENTSHFPYGMVTVNLWGPTQDNLLASQSFDNVNIPGVEFLREANADRHVYLTQDFPMLNLASAHAFTQNTQGLRACAIRRDMDPGPTKQEVESFRNTHWGFNNVSSYDPDIFDPNTGILYDDLGGGNFFATGDLKSLFPGVSWINPYHYAAVDTQNPNCPLYLFDLMQTTPGHWDLNGASYPNPRGADGRCAYPFSSVRRADMITGTIGSNP
jgi:hypothetical protein